MAYDTALEDFADRGPDPLYAVEDADELKHNIEAVAASGTVKDFGGSLVATPDLSSSWQDVINGRDQYLSATPDGMTRHVVIWSRTANAGTSVKWRVVKFDDDTTVLAGGDATEHTETTVQQDIVAITVPTSTRWKLQQKANNTSNPIYVQGQAEDYAEQTV